MAKRTASRSELVLVGAVGLKKRRPRRFEWTKAKSETFISTLADTCNVTAAAEAAGMSTAGAYARRKKDAAFRAAWAEAIATAYQRLELVLLDRALNGTEKLVKRRDGSEERMREYSNQTALALLRMHRDGATDAASEPEPADVEEIRERLVEKLERLKARFDAESENAE